MSVIEEAERNLIMLSEESGKIPLPDTDLGLVLESAHTLIRDLVEELEQREAITEAAKFLVKVKRRKDTGGAWYSASWPIALRKIEEAVDNLEEKDGE